MLTNEQNVPAPRIIGGHYEVEAELGAGGMARVYRVLDQRSGERLALKMLLISGERRATLQAMFEHEYYTLAQLVHPRIVRVFDYGLDADCPYYTMELLEGADARATLLTKAPSVREICLWLRDTASALALIHSRRLIHRDVSPRNLWCTPDGRGKLIDFGTLVAMGPQTQIVGTPPFVPPEAVYMQPLDARCDIYALGAVAYFLLTGRNAYPARDLSDLRLLWQRRPQKPDAIKPELPAALSDLVMALLSIDARGRPASAGEVAERLTAIAELPVEDERHLAQAFLTSPKLVGRDDVSGALRKRLLRAMRGRGGAVAVVASAGLGRTRMLASFVLEAKLMGVIAISVDATAVGSGSFAVAAALAERLLERLPLAAAAIAGEHAGVLGHVSPAVRRALGEPKLDELNAFDRVSKISSALIALFQAASRLQRVVLAVDDVHRADGASLGVLGRLATIAGEHRLLLVTSCDEAALAHAPPALEELVKPDNRITLTPLEKQHTHQLLDSLFGPVAGLDDAADWLHELSQGNPQTCMQYAQYLVDHALAQYEGGQWKLVPQLRQHGLPATLDAVVEGRLQALSEDARALALGLALARDESRASWQPETHLRIEDFPKLLESGDPARTFAALDELLRVGMVQQRDSYFVFVQRAAVDALVRITESPARKRMHARLAEIVALPAYQGRMWPARHLQRAGEHEQARAQIVGFANHLGSGVMDWTVMRLSVAAEVARVALAHWQECGGTPLEGIALRRILLMTCSVFDWSLARFGDAQLAQLRADCGLLHWPETDSTQPDLQRALECLQRAQQEYAQKPEAERGLSPIDAVRELGSCAMSVNAAFANSLDIAHVRTLPAILEPLRSLSPLVSMLISGCQLAIDRATGREVGDRLLVNVQTLLASTGLPDVMKFGGVFVLTHAQAIEDARYGRKRALELVDRLSMLGDSFLVLHARWLGNAFLGEAALAEKYRKQVEVITEDDVWRRKGFLFVEAQLYALTGQLVELHRCNDAIAELAAQFEGWRAWLSWTRAHMHRLRGELAQAQAELETALVQAPAGEHRVWVVAAPAHAEVLLEQGAVQDALREASAVLQTVNTLGLDLSAAVAAERVCALAQSRLFDHVAARASMERAFALAATLNYDGLPLALLCAAHARVALGAGDAEQCVAPLTRLRELLDHADAPRLVNDYESLREESSRQLDVSTLPAAVAQAHAAAAEHSQLFTQVRTRLGAYDEAEDRTRQALQLLLEDTDADAGCLFLFDENGSLRTAATSLGEILGTGNAELLSMARHYLEAELGATETAAMSEDELVAMSGTDAAMLTTAMGSRFTPVLLSELVDGRPMCMGLLLLSSQIVPLRMPRNIVVQAIGRCLRDAGDTVPVAIDD